MLFHDKYKVIGCLIDTHFFRLRAKCPFTVNQMIEVAIEQSIKISKINGIMRSIVQDSLFNTTKY